MPRPYGIVGVPNAGSPLGVVVATGSARHDNLSATSRPGRYRSTVLI